ncbi:hypothetical protein RJ640_011203 [Escallonia rubra]|uniref:Methyltransferase PMT27 n=1 Tax=Escallonia rubra TaxID=112253 RepID=A0AA88RW32_9ASTE|nr:hypothetical protein RJ640_011203 [Escallonia rubra]
MAPGKARHNKRSSGNSHASTVTTVVFVALCILGLWLLTPSSFISSPRTTTRTTTNTPAARSSSSIGSLKPRLTSKIPAPVFEDNPGDLPDDAIKSDERTTDYHNHKSKVSSTTDGESSSSGTANEAESNNDDKQDLETQKGAEAAAESENSANKEESEQGKGNAAENDNGNDVQESEKENDGDDDKSSEANVEEHVSVREETSEGVQGKVSVEEQQKHEGHETQTSEAEGVQGKVSVEEQQKHEGHETQTSEAEGVQGKVAVVEQRKHEGHESQTSEEDSKTQNQQVEEIKEMTEREESRKARRDRGKQEVQESRVRQENHQADRQVNDTHESSEESTQQNQVSDEEQEHRMEQQQLEEENQMKQEQQQQDEEQDSQGSRGAISDDQIQHDEAQVETEAPRKESEAERESNNTKEDSFPGGESSRIPKESKESKKAWSTQADQSDNEKERRKGTSEGQDQSIYGYTWQLCNVTAGPDYIPCLDNEKALRKLHSTKHYEHRERHCPEEAPTCLVSLPEGYKTPVEWPQSREKIWYHNIPHTKLAEVKGHQNWVKVTGEFLTFPGGGTQFIHGALHYIDFVQEAVPEIAWGKRTRVVLDVGCGVASFGGYLFNRDVLAMSFAPKDEHEAQVQFALERGIPAISAVMGSKRLPFPSRVFDLVHCARCRVPWHAEGGALLLELNRMLRPGGYFVWSATPVYQTLEEDAQIWKEMSALTVSMCWELVTIKKDKVNSIGAAIYHKPDSNECYEERKHNHPPMCKRDDDPNAAWYVPLQSCMHKVPVDETQRGSQWPDEWPRRLQTPPYWLNRSQMGIYGKPAPDDFAADYEHWKRVVSKSYLSGLGISWSNVRNIMDMRAVYGGFAAAMKDLKVWVLNVVNIDSPDTLPIIYERGLFGIYHDWCESFSSYPRTYDLLHADHLFSRLKKRCKIAPVMVEIDRIVRPGGKLIVRDESSAIGEVENLLKSLHWEIHMTFSKNQEGILSAQKSDWRPDSYAAPS